MSATPNATFEPPPWTAEALCAQTDPEVFFPDKGGSTREAKRVCSRCDVRTECLEYALDNDERFGIWGGLSENQRTRLSRTVPVDPGLVTEVDFTDADDFSQETA